METVTISLDTYNSMKKQIEDLTKENQQKQIIVEVKPEWWRVATLAAAFILGFGLWFVFLTGM